jgi:signal peptidase II
MKKASHFLKYFFAGIALIIIDRLTKYGALLLCVSRYQMNRYCAFELVFNRGVSFGIFYSTSPIVFWLVTTAIIVLTLGVWIYTVKQYKIGRLVWGETLVLAGSISNIIDRFLYRGVIDFIELSCAGYTWPIFNSADIFIVCGFIIMLITYYKNS